MALQTAADALDKLDGAHASLLKQTDLQFRLSQAVPQRSAFLEWLAKVLEPLGKALAPAAPYVFWTGLAIGVGFILFLICQRLFVIRRGLTLGALKLAGGEQPWRPAPEQARALLEEADRLAAEGLFVEAAHLILLRSIQDIQARRPSAVAISLTSRDIAGLEALPPPARSIFAGIAEAVEVSLFGGRALDSVGYARCRAAYQAFADAGSWA
jgi:hypothetical protein